MIATVPIELEGIPVIQVSPVLSETDIKKIQKFLMKKKEYEPETQKNYEYLQQFLHSEIAMFDCDLKRGSDSSSRKQDDHRRICG